MDDDVLEAACSKIDEIAGRLKLLLQHGSPDELDAIRAELDEANLHLKEIVSERLARDRGQQPPLIPL